MPLTSILLIQYMQLSRTPAPQQITSWYLIGKTKSYLGLHASTEKLAVNVLKCRNGLEVSN